MRTQTPTSLLIAFWLLLLSGCTSPQLQVLQTQLTLTLSRQATLDSAGSGLSGYFCRRVICAGDDGENNAVRGLLQFDLDPMLVGVHTSQITTATLRLYQNEASRTYGQLQSLLVDHIRVEDLLEATAFSAPGLVTARNDLPGEGYIEIDVSQALKSALALGHSSVQFRLRFSRATNNDNQSSLAMFSIADGYAPQLTIHLGRP